MPDSRTDRPLRIAMIGQRGLPPTYGGIEHHVARLGRRLAERGHEVTVYCRTNYVPERLPEYHGMRLRHLPTIGTKHLDAIAHSVLSTLAATRLRPDIIHYHALGPGLCTPVAKLAVPGARVVQTVHGMDNRRAKWGRVARTVLGTARWMSDRYPDGLIAVSAEVEGEYALTRQGRTVRISNGVDRPAPVAEADAASIAARYGLRAGKYVLYVGRLVPEKAPDLLMDVFRRLPGDVDLAVAGGWAYSGDFVDRLAELGSLDPRIKMLDYVYGEDLAALYSAAAVFVQPSQLEGMPLTLLEAASYGIPLVASEIPPHREVLGTGGPGARFFRSGDGDGLLAALRSAIDGGEAERAAARARAQTVLDRFSWDTAAAATEEFYRSILAREAAARTPVGT